MAYRKAKPVAYQKPSPAATIDWTQSVSQGLVQRYLFNERAGIKATDLVSRQYCNFQGAALTMTSGWGPGKFGTTAVCDGVNDYFSGFDSVPMNTSAVTISCWLYMTGHSDWAGLISKNAVTSNSTQWDWGILFSEASDNIFLVRNGANTSATTTALSRNVWQHIVAIVSANRTALYINGLLKETGAAVGVGNTTNTAGRYVQIMGAGPNLTPAVVGGKIENAAVWNRELQPSEIRLLYEQPFSGISAPRVVMRSGTTSGTTLAITGVSATGSAGSVKSAISAPLSGTAATGAAGTTTAKITRALTGSAATMSPGTVTASVGVSRAITGNAATASAGTAKAAITGSITGSGATASAGTVTAVTGVLRALTGSSATTSAGTVQPSISAVVTGGAATPAAGTPKATIAMALTGLAATSAAGTMTASTTVSATRALTGASATASAGRVRHLEAPGTQAEDSSFGYNYVYGY